VREIGIEDGKGIEGVKDVEGVELLRDVEVPIRSLKTAP
jgi:hypothetical protein